MLKPAVRLLLQHGVTYGALASALKRVFLAAAQDELKSRGMARTDSAITLLSGVHRRDVRTLRRTETPAEAPTRRESLSLAGEVVSRWLITRPWVDSRRRPRALTRDEPAGGFDALVTSVSSDVRPRAMLEELKRLGVVEEAADGTIRLLQGSFAPQRGFEEMTLLLADNLHDHLLATTKNIQGLGNFLEQSVHVAEISAESAAQLQQAAVTAWKKLRPDFFALAQRRFDEDAIDATQAQRCHRARFGVYFLVDDDKDA